jgi:hypothetical protein
MVRALHSGLRMKTTSDVKTLDVSTLAAISGGYHHHWHHHGHHRQDWYDRRAYVMAAQAPTIIIAR